MVHTPGTRMVLSMPRPQLRSGSHTYRLRRRVPADLVAVVGRREVTLSLKTKDPAEAKRLMAEELVKLETRWATLRRGPQTLSEREAHEIAAAVHDAWLIRHADEPSVQTFWPVDVGARVFTRPPLDASKSAVGMVCDIPDLGRLMGLEQWCYEGADRALQDRGLLVDEDGRRKLARAVGAAVQRASLTLQRMACGEIPDGYALPSAPAPIRAPAAQPSTPIAPTLRRQAAPIRGKAARVTLTGLVEGWWVEAEKTGKSASTRESYTNTMRGFVAFLKHDDATRVTVEDVIAYKDHRLRSVGRGGKPISPQTVKNSDLAGLKSVFGWAVANRQLPVNPATGISVMKVAKTQTRDKWFTDEETTRILRAALQHQQGDELPETFAAKRWVPWLMAFTGARVGELVQLRKQDLRRVELDGHPDGTWVLTITPEAGTVKTKKLREVPLHPQLVALGFPEFAASVRKERLFLVPDETGGITGPLQGVKNRLAEFGREQVSDPGVAPNHGWRHRFSYLATDLNFGEKVTNALCGWSAKSVAERYGGVSLKARADAINRLAWVKV